MVGPTHPICSMIYGSTGATHFDQLAKILTGYEITGARSSGIFMGILSMEMPWAIGHDGAPLPDLNRPISPLPDLNLPAEPSDSEEPYQPLFPLVGSLSVEEQREVDRFVRFEKRLVRSATCMLKSLDYCPQADDVKNVVQSFLLEIDSIRSYEEFILSFIDPTSSTFINFLDFWEGYLADIGSLVQNVLI